MLYPENALLLAPLSGFTDLPYRRAARSCGCRFAFTEMVDAASLAYSPDRAALLLRRGEEEDFLAAQIVGADVELLKRACDELNKYDFNLLDFNLGCPVQKIAKKGAGATLGRHLEQALACFEVLVRNSKFPLTAKLRIVSNFDPQPTLDLACGLVELGAKAITIHGRTLEGFYTGEMHPEIIRLVNEKIGSQVPVIANGGVHDLASYEALREKSGVSRVMLAQGAMGNPWLFRVLQGGGNPTYHEWNALLRRHVQGMIDLYGEYSAMRQARKIVFDYLKGRGFPTAVRARASGLCSMADLDVLLLSAEPVSKIVPRPFAPAE